MPKVKKAPAQKVEESEEIVPPSKIKKGDDAEEAEVFGSDKDEDTESPLAAVSDDGDDLGEDGDIDTEEINPFGDKWEE